MLEPLLWEREWRSRKSQTLKLSAEARPLQNDFLSEGGFRFSSLTKSTNHWTSPRLWYLDPKDAFSNLRMNERKGWDHFVSYSDVIGSKIPLKVERLQIPTASEVCAEEEMTQTRPFMFHAWWISGFLVGSDASWAVDCHRNACMRIGDAPGEFFLVDFEGSFALGFCDQYRSYDSKMTIKTLNEVCINACRAIL